MQRSPVKFSILQFSRPCSQGVTILLLDSQDGNQLGVWIDADWRERIDVRDQEYLSELLVQWKHAGSTEHHLLWDELCKQSHGPLRVVERGSTSAGDYEALTKGRVEFPIEVNGHWG